MPSEASDEASPGRSSSSAAQWCPASSSTAQPSLQPPAETSAARRQMDPVSLEEALEAAAQCAQLDREQGDSNDSTWQQTVKLRPLLSLAAQPQFVPPARFQQAMETCVACLLHATPGHLMQPARILQLLDSPDAGPLLRYLTWLEEALKEMKPSSSSDGGCRTVLVPQRVRSALSSWPAERSLLQQSAAALWEALAKNTMEYIRIFQEWKKSMQDREAIQEQQSEDCQRVVQEFEGAVSFLVDQVSEKASVEWPELARVTEESLWRIQQLSSDLLQSKQECWSQALEDYEALGAKRVSCNAAMTEVKRTVRRNEQAFSQAAQRFTEVANQLVAWTCVLVPKLRLLEGHTSELRTVVELRRQVPTLEREHLQAEDELDTAQTELRKHRRHSQASQAKAQKPHGRPASGTDAAAAAFVLERQCELRISNSQKRVNALLEQLRDAENRLREAEAKLPVELDLEEEVPAGSSSGGTAFEPPNRDLSNEEKLALKLATLQQFHEDLVVEVSQTQVERDRILRKVEQRKVQAALRRHVEPDFMCPILHERMKVPVLAADGFTYERQAIEKWLSMHNTSPMTGAILAHRYLTENYALRHLIDAYEVQLASKLKHAPRRKDHDKKAGDDLKRGEREEDVGDFSDAEDVGPDDAEDPEEEDLGALEDEEWDDSQASIRRGAPVEEDMPILTHQRDDG